MRFVIVAVVAFVGGFVLAATRPTPGWVCLGHDTIGCNAWRCQRECGPRP